MCGIAGIINTPDQSLIQRLSNTLQHRGPDEQNHYSERNLSLIHTRLSIQDIKHGQQPLHYGNCVIIFNGQIYNHLELRKRYLPHEKFLTRSDTETLLAMYIKFGKEMFQYLDGMFAFAIFDKNKNQLLLSRDRAGKKPLYFYQKNGVFAFASELNALRAVFPVTIHHEAIHSLLHCGFLFSEYTPYQEVQELPAATCLTIDLTSLTSQQETYFNLLECYQKPKLNLTLPAALEQLDTTLRTAVEDRLLSSEVEVGAFLSGGIDSSLIVALAAQKKTRLKTFTIKFPGAYDESSLANLTAKRYQTEHTEINITLNVAQDLEKILLNYGEPFLDSSAIPSYYVAHEAKKYVSVVLNGDGADELFAGYRRYVPIANHWIQLASRFSWLTTLLPYPHNKQSKYNYLYRLLSMAKKTGLDFYTSATGDAFSDCYHFNNNAIDQKVDAFIRHTQNNARLSALDQILYLDFNILLFSDLLKKMDIATMAHSLEARSPFLSKEIVTLATSLPDNYKIHGTNTKYLLRELAKKYLSPELIQQPKRGFEVPLKAWVDGILKDKIRYYLQGAPLVANYVNNNFIQQLLQKKIATSDEKRAKMLWALLATEIWLRHQ